MAIKASSKIEKSGQGHSAGVTLPSMSTFAEYQAMVERTNERPSRTVSLMGLVGEVGDLHSMMKKLLLQKANPAFRTDWIEEKFVFRAEAGQPIITRNYSQRIPDHRTPLEGLYLANTLQIYPEDRGTNYSVRLGQKISRIVDQDLGHEP